MRPRGCRFWPRQRLGRQKRWATQISNPGNSGTTLWLPSHSLDSFKLLVPLERAEYCILLNQRSPYHFGFAIRFFEILCRISLQLGLFRLVHNRITSLILNSPQLVWLLLLLVCCEFWHILNFEGCDWGRYRGVDTVKLEHGDREWGCSGICARPGEWRDLPNSRYYN
jgi:hypothetical protein